MSSKASGKQGGETALTPKLRFPEFRDAPGWEESPLSKFVSSLDAGVSVNSGDRPANEGEAGILKTSSVTDGVFAPQENKVVKDEAEVQRLKEAVCGNTIIISRMNTPALVGANAYVETTMDNIFLPDRLWAAKPKPDSSMRFLAHVLGSKKGRAALAALGSGTSDSMKNITKPDVLALRILAPSTEEQNKVAECLTTLNEVIAAQSLKLDALKAHKQRLMQQLFPREGETTPRLRFPEFQAAPAWKSTRAGELFAHRIESGEVELPIYSVTMNDGMVKRSSLDRHVDDVADLAANKKAFKDDIAYNMMRMWQGAFGVAVENCMVSPAYVVLAPRKGTYSVFFEYLLKLPGSLRLLTANSQGLTKDRLRLYYKDFATILLPHPDYGEQQRIATLLATIDGLIAAHSVKFEALQTHKKGLMQQLFPSPGQVEP